MFETLYSQDLYLRFADFQNKQFFVNKSNNAEVEEKTLSEIKAMIQKQKKAQYDVRKIFRYKQSRHRS